MIKINLLNYYSDTSGGVVISEDDEKKQILIDFAKRAIVLVLGPLGLYVYEMQAIPEMQKKLNEANANVTEIRLFNDGKQGLAQEIKKFEDEQRRFNSQMDFINKITKDKVNEYKLFLHLKDSTPNNIWIKKLEYLNNTLTIMAESDDPREFDNFTQNLTKTEFIFNVVPLNQSIGDKNYMKSGTSTTVLTIKAQMGAGEAL